MSALLDSLASAFAGDARQRALLDAALRDGLPGPRSEAWKYTSLRALERRSFAAANEAVPAFDATLLDGIPAPRLVFVNGVFDALHSDVSGLPDGVRFDAHAGPEPFTDDVDATPDAVFSRLNAALARTGMRLEADDGVRVDAPLHVVHVGVSSGHDQAWHLRHRVVLGEGAALSLAEYHLADGTHRHLDTTRLSLHVAACATLRHARVQANAGTATSFLRSVGTLAADARYERIDLELGGGLSRHELDIRLDGERAALVANGVLFASGRRHVDTRLGIGHAARDTRCELTWRGIGAGRGRAVFHGGITIHEGADGADARLSNKNLLLSADAEIDTQPVLVIHADEVQAAHGATVGQLDGNALFYLRSRGLAVADATRLLTAAFVREPLSAAGSPALRESLQARLDAALAGLDA